VDAQKHTHSNKGALDKVRDDLAGDAWLDNSGAYSVPSGGPEALYVDGSNDMDAPVSFAAASALDQKRVEFYDPDWWIGLSDVGGRLDVSIGNDLGNHFFRVMSQGTIARFAVGNSLITASVPITGVHPPTASGHLATKQYVDDNAGGGSGVPNSGSQFPPNTSFPGDTIPSGYQFYRTDIDVQFLWNGTMWVPAASYAALDIYVSSAGTGDPYDAGDGVTTLAAAWAAIPSVFNADVTIHVANGTYGDGTTEELGGKTPGGPFFVYITGSAKANVNYGNPLSLTGQSNLRFSGITFTRKLTILDTSNVRYDECDIDTSTDVNAIDGYGGNVGFVFYDGTLRVTGQSNPHVVFMRAADNMKFELSEIIGNNCSGTYIAVRADFATLVYCRSTNIRSVGGTATTRKAFQLSRTVIHAYRSPDGGSPASEIESSMNYGVEFLSFSSISFNTTANIVNNATANKWVDTANTNSGGG
jgi:hypothetical protein